MTRPYLGNPKYTIEVLQKYNFAFQKRFGQNFLIDTHVLEKIIEASKITKDDFVLEIGPGIGTMTQYLAEAAREVVAVEIDKTLIPILENDTLKDWDNVTVINEDILKVDIAALAQEKNGGKPIKVVANLPYYITTPIIMGLFENEVYTGIPKMLRELQAKGYFLAVASSKPQVYVERILEHFDLKKYFVVVVGSELDGRRETKDQVVQETLRQLFGESPVDPAQVYMIGDRKFDVEGARALGVESVGVTYGYGSKEELKEAKADYIVQSVDELEKFLLRGSEELRNSNPDAKKKNPMYQRIWTMVYSFLMFILVRNVIQYALLALLYQLAQSGASGGLVDLLILRDETGAYNGYSGDVSSIIAALGFIGGAIAVWSTAKLLIDKNKEDMHLSHLKKEGKARYALLVAATIGAVIGCNLLFELLGVTNKSEAYTEVASQQYSAHFIVGILVFGFISPIAEELLFRGVIYGYLRRFLNLRLAIALSALIFGVYHMNYVQGVYGFLIGCLMAYAYEYFGEFKMAIFVHVASNVLAYCLSYTAIAVTGFVSWPVCVIFLTVAAVSLGMLHKQKNIF